MIIADLKQNPRTLPEISKLYFPTVAHPHGSYKRCHRWVMKHMKRGQLRRSTGVIEGEIVHVYSTKIISAVEHEYKITQLSDLFGEAVAGRGQTLPHCADVKLRFGKTVWWGEMDCDTENAKQTKGRLAEYAVLPGDEFVLFICPDEKRAAAIRELAPDATTHHLYTCIFAELRSDPWGEILTDCSGAKGRLVDQDEEKHEEPREEPMGTSPQTCPSADPDSPHHQQERRGFWSWLVSSNP